MLTTCLTSEIESDNLFDERKSEGEEQRNSVVALR